MLAAGQEIFQIAPEPEQTGQVFSEALALSCRDQRVIPSPAGAHQLAARGRLSDMLDPAIKLQQDRARLYQEIAWGVGNIIAEEQDHVQQLSLIRASLH